ncbi:low temperature requirement protein A [Agrobacterium sp. rho-13.3]|jgi:low temperature requirement protein LtrA|uniref:low temperature requirement protein A n=1 Tax=Agrobacterium sp. rho-13.3 TaxID=3072980 RepID=UPI002A154E1C|nr:low temperature requirement protein A [Agrobacterium sp. rho-13.3]MDX8306448.1 low temperature requirement protein A [Agrobacterium sp. rho-13.3]MDX8307221.1 low temperature requirement protein A [Agrobacterium sp. rho-13.3]
MKKTTATSGAKSDPKWRLIRQDDAEAGKATFPELFFDLVFVFALIQLSHTLAENFGSTALVEAAILILALWWLWVHITWLTNLLNTEAGPVRLFLFFMMFTGVLLAIALPKAFEGHGLVFALIYSGMQLVRSLFALYVFKGVDHENSLTFSRMGLWLAFSSIFWLAGGMSSTLEWQLGFWAVAIGIEYAGPLVKYYFPGFKTGKNERLHLSGEHLAERCALFVIICLGETILTTGRTATDHMNSSLTFVVFCSAFASTVLMWWIYFHHGQEKVSEKAEGTAEPEKIAQNLFNYGHLPIVAGIILTAVGEDFSLSHSHEDSTLREALAIVGGPMLFLAGNIGVKIASSFVRPISHFVGIAVLAVLLFLPGMPLYILQIASASILLLVAVWEYVALRKHSPSVS